MFFQKRIQTPVIFQVCKQTAVNIPKYKQSTHLKKCKQTAESKLDMGHVAISKDLDKEPNTSLRFMS